MRTLSFVILIFTLSIFLAACGGQDSDQQNQEDQTNNDHNANQEVVGGDIRETTESMEVLPTFLDDYHEDIITIYTNVPQHQELLEHIPCYCGCDSIDHGSVYHCFIHEQNGDGAIVWDDHGARCNVCLDIAHASMKFADQGLSPSEIRDVVDQAHQEGYGNPTQTPKPTK